MAASKGYCFVPVFSDLVFEDSRSPLISAVTSLRVLIQAYALGLFASMGLYSPGLSCPEALGKPKPGEDAASLIFFFAFTLLSALASSRAQSRRFILPALISGIVYIGLLSGVDLPACDAIVKSGYAMGSSAAAVAIVAVDTTFSFVTLGCLAMLLAEDPPAAIGYAAPRVPEERFSRIVAAVSALRDEASQTSNIKDSSFSTWVTRTIRGIHIAPLRHHLAAALTSSFVIAFASITGSASTMMRKYKDKLAEGIGMFFADMLADVITSIFVGALISCFCALAAIAASYAPIFDDLVAYAIATTSSTTSTTETASAVNTKGEGMTTSDSNNSSVTASPLSTPLVEESPQRTPPASTNVLDEFVQYITQGLGMPFKDNALDFDGNFFSYYKASSYTALFVMNLLTLFALTAGIVSFIIFIMTSKATFNIAIRLVVAFVASWLYQRAAAWFYARWVAKGTQILRPRLFVLCDFVFSCSFGIAQGFTTALTRFVLGLLFMLVQMTNISRPLAPMQLAGLDSGFVAYGSMLKASLAPFPREEADVSISSSSTSSSSSSVDIFTTNQGTATIPHQGNADAGVKSFSGIQIDPSSVPASRIM